MHSSLELGTYVCFLEEATSSSFGDKIIFNCVRVITACHALWSRVGLQGFRSEIG